MIVKCLRYIGYLLYRPLWWLQLLIPRNDRIWLFGAWYGQKYSDNSKWLFEYVINNYPEITAVWITKSDNVYKLLCSKNLPVYKSWSLKGILYSLRAKWCFLSSGTVDVNRYFLNGSRNVLLWHGMPLKKIGYSDSTLIKSIRKVKLIEKINPYVTLHPYSTLSSAPFFDEYLMEAFNLKSDRVWDLGIPRCDAFFTKKEDKIIHMIHEKNKSAKIMLYLPTFRMTSDGKGSYFSPFDSKFGFNQAEFVEFLEKKNIIMLYKPHFMDASVDINISSSNFIKLSDSEVEDLYVLLSNIDALITDYSSVYFDFLPSRKTMFLCPFDYEDYVSKSREHYFNMYEEMDAVVCNNWQEFYNEAGQLEWKKLKDSEINQFASCLDGNVCRKIVNKILNEGGR